MCGLGFGSRVMPPLSARARACSLSASPMSSREACTSAPTWSGLGLGLALVLGLGLGLGLGLVLGLGLGLGYGLGLGLGYGLGLGSAPTSAAGTPFRVA